jgi:hypothetical protein
MGEGEKGQDFERGDDHVDWHYGEVEIWVYIYRGWWQMVINLKLDVGGFVDFLMWEGRKWKCAPKEEDMGKSLLFD